MTEIDFKYLYYENKSFFKTSFIISDFATNSKQVVAAFSENARLCQPHLMIDGSYKDEIFSNNLILVESFLPSMLMYITSKFSNQRIPIAIAGEHLTKLNPLKYEHLRDYYFYEAKLKKLLFELLIGMEVDRVWDGQYHTEGSCIVVSKGCEKEYYSIYNANLLQEYLFLTSSIEGNKDGVKIYHK